MTVLYAGAMIIRQAAEPDIPAIAAIEQIPTYRNFIGSWPEEQHRDVWASADSRYLVAVDEADAVAGFAILLGLCNVHRSIELKRIAVGAPGLGVGRTLLHAAAEVAFSELGAHRLWLDVFESNYRAQHVYRSFGFREDGLLREADYFEGSYRTLRLMSILDREYNALHRKP